MQDNDQIVTVEAMAQLCNLTNRRVQQLQNEDVMHKASAGKYYLVRSVNGYIKYLQERAENAKESDISSEIEKQKLEKLRLEVSEARRKEMLSKGESDTRENIERVYTRALRDIRDHIERFVETMKSKNKKLTASESERIDRELARLFNGIADDCAVKR